jgi:LysR family transcriptional regulator, nitrogen assimilation regulatory protein
MLTLRQLRYFIAVVEAGSITRAADAMRVASTALSQQMKALEDHFGIVLIHRHSRGVLPTESGAALLEQARRILSILDETERQLGARHRLPDRPVLLGIPPGLARLIGVGAFVGAPERFKGLALTIVDGWALNLAQRLDAGELDFVVGYELEASKATEVIDLMEDRVVFVGPPNATSEGTRPISLSEALASNLIFFGDESVGWRMARAAALAANLSMCKNQHVESISIWRELICQGVGTSIAPFATIADEFRRGEVAVREFEGERFVVRVSLGVRHELCGEVWAQELIGFLIELVHEAQARHAPHIRRIDKTRRMPASLARA